MNGIGALNFQVGLSRHTRDILEDNWQVGTGATTSVLPCTLANPSGTTIGLTGGVQTRLQGSICEFTSGANVGQSAVVSSVSADGTITLDAALPHTPAEGDTFVLVQGDLPGAIDLVALAILSDQSAATDFGEFTAPFAGTVSVLVSLATTSTVNLMATPVGGSQVNIGAVNSDVAISASQPFTFSFPISRGVAYAFQLGTAQSGPMYINVKGASR